MRDRTIHPNTRILLEAWRRMAVNPDELVEGPRASDYPNLIDRLFVLRRTAEDAWVFTNTGSALNRLLGRELEGHDFLSLWSGNERLMVSALVQSTASASEPSIIRLSGESLRGYRCDLEMPLAPLTSKSGMRMLGLYQSLGGEAMLHGRTIWKHNLTSIQMPTRRAPEPRIKLVASND